jgi:phosphohistidine phosphatase
MMPSDPVKYLTLLRHAKAVEAVAGLSDHDRELRPRGRKAAAWVGRETAKAVPELVLCSTSARTRETLAELLDAWGGRPKIEYDRALYLVSADALLRRLAQVSAKVGSIWLVGHNPGVHELALRLAGAAKAFPELSQRFPTSARAVFSLDGSWADLGSKPSHLQDFIIPPKD